MKIINIASEAKPLAKTGGLADVVHALSRELVEMGEEVIVVLPFYEEIKKKKEFAFEMIKTSHVYMSWRTQEYHIHKVKIDGILFYLLENHQYFDRSNLYGYPDDTERFAFFTMAVRDFMKVMDYRPDIVHIHDWQAGLLPTIIKEQNHNDWFFHDMKFVLTIHNPAFQGLFDPYLLGDYYSLDREVFESGKVRFKGVVSSLKAALIYCDKITTVSPTHAQELLTHDGSQGLEDITTLRKDDFVGILNGIDYQEFNPKDDAKIPYPYGKGQVKKNKELNKIALLEKVHLENTGNALFGIVSRLTWQKGIDLVMFAARHLLEQGASIVILGSGEYGYEQSLEALRREYPHRMAIYIGYNDNLAHLIYAGCDFFLMPSLFEPCGIGQMIALRYGCLPIVRMTGGLKDTIVPLDQNIEIANGFGFYTYEPSAIINTVQYALECYEDKAIMKQLIKNALEANNDWRKSASEYLKLYHSLVKYQ